MLLIVAIVGTLSYLGWNFLLTVIIGLIPLVPILVIPQLYLMRLLEPIIQDLPRTDQRITQRELNEKVAVSTPAMARDRRYRRRYRHDPGGMMDLVDAVMKPRGDNRWVQPVFALVGGAAALAYFVYVARLKGKQNRAP